MINCTLGVDGPFEPRLLDGGPSGRFDFGLYMTHAKVIITTSSATSYSDHLARSHTR